MTTFGFSWDAVPSWMGWVFSLVISTTLVILIDLILRGRWHGGETGWIVPTAEPRLAVAGVRRSPLQASLTQSEGEGHPRLDPHGRRVMETAELNAQAGPLRAEIESGAAARSGPQSDVQSQDGAVAGLKAQLGKLEADLSTEKARGRSLAAEVDRLTSVVNAAAAVAKGLEGDKARLQADLNAALKGKAAAETSAGDLKVRLGAAVADVEAAKSAHASAAAEVARLSASALASAGLAKRLEEDKRKLETDLAGARNAQRDLQGRMDALAAERASLEGVLTRRDEELGPLKVRLGALQVELDKTQTMRASAETLAAQVPALQTEGAALKAKTASLEAGLAAANAARTEADARQRSALADANALRVKLDAAMATVARAAPVEAMERLQARVAQLEDALKGAEEARARAEATAAAEASAPLRAALADAGMWRVRFEESASAAVSLEESGKESGAQLRMALADAAMWRARYEDASRSAAEIENRGNEASGRLGAALADAAMWRARAEGLTTEEARLASESAEAHAKLNAAMADAAMWRTRFDESDASNANFASETDEASARYHAALADAAMWRTRHEEAEKARVAVEAAGLENGARYQAALADAAMWRAKHEDALAAASSMAGAPAAPVAAGAVSAADMAEAKSLVSTLRRQLTAANKRIAGLQAELGDDAVKRDALKAQIATLKAERPNVRATAAAPAAQAPAPKRDRPTQKKRTQAGPTASCPQHLSNIKGIGTVFEQRLYAAGIGTYSELASARKSDLIRVLALTPLQKARFDYAGIKAHAMRLARESSSVGRTWDGRKPDDFEPMDGIGFTLEKRLYDGGICTYAALIAATDERLNEVCRPGKNRKLDYAHWRAQARALMAKAR